jgi:CRP/FNR family cyclic AMP-dependent transcriptional regulator
VQNTMSRRRGKKRRTTLLHYPAGTTLFDQDDPARRVYALDSGRIRLASGRQAVLDYLTAGHFFGLKCLLRNPTTQSADALTGVKLSAFNKLRLLDQLQRDRRFALRLLESLATRLDRYERIIHSFITEGAERRLARLLLRLASGQGTSGWTDLPDELTNLELAKMVGTTRWRISHFLTRFQQNDLMRRHGRMFSVHRERLAEFLRSPSR